jgi:hypothetical protein
MRVVIRKWGRPKTASVNSQVFARENPDQSPDAPTDALAGDKNPSPNFVTNFLIPVWDIAFGHDELRERYLSLKPKRPHD